MQTSWLSLCLNIKKGRGYTNKIFDLSETKNSMRAEMSII